jgi:phage/plasmid primase-like uncharacterized protein
LQKNIFAIICLFCHFNGDAMNRSKINWKQIISELLPKFDEALDKIGTHVRCPMHGGKDGFRLYPNFEETGGGVCNTCGSFSNGIKLIEKARKCSQKEALAAVDTWLKKNGTTHPLKNSKPIKAKCTKNINISTKGWIQNIIKEAQIDSGRISKYLKSRGLVGDVPEGILFHPTVPYFEDGKKVGNFPAMVALITKGDQNLGLHLTYLAENGDGKASVPNPKKLLKITPDITLSGGAVWLKHPEIGQPIILCEGIETGLACLQATGYSVAACGNTSLLGSASLPKERRKIIIAADNDKNNAGLNAAETLANRLFQEGREVYLKMPPGIHVDDQSSIDWLDIHNNNGPNFIKEQFSTSNPWEPRQITTLLPSEDSTQSKVVTFETISLKSGLASLQESSTPDEIAQTVRRFADFTKNIDSITLGIFKSGLIKELKSIKLQGAADNVKLAYSELTGNDKTQTQNNGSLFENVEPWAEEVYGAELAEEIRTILNQYLILPKGADVAITLWIFFTWVYDAFSIAPMLIFESPVMRCGKSTALRILSKLVKHPLLSSNITPAAIFRSIEAFSPTLIIDEADTFLDSSSEIRGIINAGHERENAFVVRTVGEEFLPTRFDVFGPKVISGIGSRKGTLIDRGIVIEMKRRGPNDHVDRFKSRRENRLNNIQRKLARWATDSIEDLEELVRELPEQLNDRQADNWEPLFSISNSLGKPWIDDSIHSALALSHVRDDEELGVQLLHDIKNIFETNSNPETIFTSDILKELGLMEEKPWPEFQKSGKLITPRGIAQLLKPFGVKPECIRGGLKKGKGYKLGHFKDAFFRYLGDTKQKKNKIPLRVKIKRGKRGNTEKSGVA